MSSEAESNRRNLVALILVFVIMILIPLKINFEIMIPLLVIIFKIKERVFFVPHVLLFLREIYYNDYRSYM
jgi:hypothetical protein